LAIENPSRPTGLRLDVPHGDVDAGDRLHDHATASAFIGLRHPARERRRCARAVVHLLVDALGEHRVLADRLRGELVFDDGGNDQGRSERCADPGDAVARLDANERRIALDLGPEVGAVALVLGDRCRHGKGGYLGDLHRRVSSSGAVQSRAARA
jgi:hypothetical protein